MPNWVFNNLHIEGSVEAIEKVKTQLNKPYITKHTGFEKKVSITAYDNPVIAFWNIVAPPPEKIDIYFSSADSEADAEWNWYAWNNHNWGTKWDIGVSNDNKFPETSFNQNSDTSIQYSFQTAWSPPLPVIEALSLQYPELEITLEYEEEQGWGGEIFWDSTGSSIVREYDIPDSHEDFESRDNVDGCNCANSEDKDDWYDDCPGKTPDVIELFAKRDVTQLTEKIS
jgi:hypothetical protein